MKFRKGDKKMERYKQVLAMCKKPSFPDPIAESLNVTVETIKHDLRVLSMLKFVQFEVVEHGTFRTKRNLWKTLRTDLTRESFDEMLRLSAEIYKVRDKRVNKSDPQPPTPIISQILMPVFKSIKTAKKVLMLTESEKYADKFKEQSRQINKDRKSPKTHAGSSFGLVGW